MSRRRSAPKRLIIPDPKFGDVMVSRFINCLMWEGKKAVAEGLLFGAFDLIQSKGSDPLQIFRKAISTVKPALEVRSKRIGGATCPVPVEVSVSRSEALACRWIIRSARTRPEKTMTEKLAFELMDASNQRGAAYKKKDDTHRMAEANKAFAHYRW